MIHRYIELGNLRVQKQETALYDYYSHSLSQEQSDATLNIEDLYSDKQNVNQSFMMNTSELNQSTNKDIYSVLKQSQLLPDSVSYQNNNKEEESLLLNHTLVSDKSDLSTCSSFLNKSFELQNSSSSIIKEYEYQPKPISPSSALSTLSEYVS